MAVVDAEYKFIMVDVGSAGRNSDGGIYRNSYISKKFANQEFNVPEPEHLIENGPKLTYFLIGDAAFPLSMYLLRPFSANNINLKKTIFNYRLSRARRCVENAFGILAAKFRLFRRPIIADKKNVIKFVKSCIVLHNFLITKESFHYNYTGLADSESEAGDVIPGAWRNLSSNALIALGRVGATNYSCLANNQRDYLCNYFLTPQGALKFQWNKHF